MQKLSILLIILLVTTSCQKTSQSKDTAVLTMHACALIDLFLTEMEDAIVTYNDSKQIVIFGYANLNSYEIDIISHSPKYKPYGQYCGKVHYKKYEILLFGDSWNDYFWSSDTTYFIEDKNSKEWDNVFYDPIAWSICINVRDTTINEARSELADYSLCTSVTSRDNIFLLDSIEKIIRH